jgi:hypothetical protein
MMRAISGTLLGIATLLVPFDASAGTKVTGPLDCTRGPSGQMFHVIVTMPSQVEEGARFAVRVDGVGSGTISHTGLRYIHDMTSDYLIPSGTVLVPGSLKIVPKTGSANVAGSASIAKVGNVIRLTLPGHVENDSSYTSPSFELELEPKSAVGSKVVFQFSSYHVMAKAFIVGDVETTCTPKPQPFTLATATIVAKP